MPAVADIAADPLPPPAPLPDGTPSIPLPVAPPLDPRSEAIAGAGLQAGAWAYARGLPQAGSDLQRDFGLDLFDRMAHDPQIAAALGVVVKATLAHPVGLVPWMAEAGQVQDPQRISTFCRQNLDRLPIPLHSILNELLTGALRQGHKLAEQIYALDTYLPDLGPQIVLRDLKPKPLTSYAFVEDAFNNDLGLLVQQPGRPLINPGILLAGAAKDLHLIPRRKVAVLGWETQNHDPRGTSHLRDVYGPWIAKQQTFPTLLAFLARFGQPNVWAELPPNAQPPVDPTTGQPVLNPDGTRQTAIDQQLRTLQTWAAGGALSLANAQKAGLIEPQSDGAAILHAVEHYNTEIVKGLTFQSLGTDQGAHSSRAQAVVHQDMLGLLVRYAKTVVAAFLRVEILMPLVLYNFGAAAVPLTPLVDLGQDAPEDFGAVGQVLAQLNNKNPRGFFAPSQFRGLDSRLGFPIRTEAEAAAMWDGVPADGTPADDNPGGMLDEGSAA